MNIEEIRKNAPEGATEYLVDNFGNIIYTKYGSIGLMYYKEKGTWYCANDDIKPYLKPL